MRKKLRILSYMLICALLGAFLALINCGCNHQINTGQTKEMTSDEFKSTLQDIGPVTASDVETKNEGDETVFKYNSSFIDQLPTIGDNEQCRDYLNKALKLKYGEGFSISDYISCVQSDLDKNHITWWYNAQAKDGTKFQARCNCLTVGTKIMASNDDNYQDTCYSEQLVKVFKDAIDKKSPSTYVVNLDNITAYDKIKVLELDDNCYANMLDWFNSKLTHCKLEFFTEDGDLTYDQICNIRQYFETFTERDKKHMVSYFYQDKTGQLNVEQNYSSLVNKDDANLQTTLSTEAQKFVNKLPNTSNGEWDKYYSSSD